MAKVVRCNDTDMFMVGLGVGAGRANNLDDVTLVQYLLNIWLDHPKTAVYRRRLGATGGKLLAVDGIFGPKTGARILHLQKYFCEQGITTACDGRIDRMPDGEMFAGSGANAKFRTIWSLNIHVGWLFVGVEEYSVLELYKRHDFPVRLIPMVRRYMGQTQAA